MPEDKTHITKKQIAILKDECLKCGEEDAIDYILFIIHGWIDKLY